MAILDVAFNLVTRVAMLLIFIRFMMQWAEMDRHHPLIAPMFRATAVVDVFSRIFPTLAQGRFSLAAVVLMLLIRLISLWGNAVLGTIPVMAPAELFLNASFSLIIDFLSMCRYLIFGSIIISWIVVFTNTMHPILAVIMQLAEPILAPFRRITPNLGMIDLSPILAFFGIYVAQILVSNVADRLLSMV